MKILFIIPKISDQYINQFYELSENWRHWKHLRRDLKKHERYAKRVFYGQGIILMASLLNEYKCQIEFIDENFEEINFNKKYDLIALTGIIIQNKRIQELIKIFKNKGIYIVLGGIQATLYPECFIQKGISVIAGEGEMLFKEFINDFHAGNPKPLYQTHKSENIDLNILPIPRYELASKYRYNLIGIQTTRGCPFNCEYCNVTNILGDKYRHKSIERVKDEVKIVKKYWPNSMFYFFDDALFADREYALKLFECLKDIPLGSFGSHGDISIYKDKELLQLLKAVGEPVLAIGFETLALQNAKFIKNKMKADLIPKYQEAVEELTRNGIKITGSFMCGFKGDTINNIEIIMDFVLKNNINAYFTMYSATPKSRLFNRLVKEYESQNREIGTIGFERVQIINKYLLEINNFYDHEVEDMVLAVLKKYYPDEIPIARLEGLVVSRGYQNPNIF